jgi:acetyl esterase
VSGPPVLDDDMAALVAAMARGGVRPWSELGVAGSRRRMRDTPRPPGPPVYAVEQHTAAGPHGPVPVRLYRPVEADAAPVVVYLHGGGMVFGDLDSFDGFARRLAVASGAVVASVGYRLAPEHRYPVAGDDARAAIEWLHATAASLNLDRTRVGVAGDSAGGSLAAGLALHLRDHGGPALRFQLLMYPGLERYNAERPSMRELAGGPMLTARDIVWLKEQYLGPDPRTDTPYGVPMLAADLSGLPDAIVVTAAVDPLRDSAERYGHRLRDAGVPVAMLRYPGVCHGFMGAAGSIARGRTAFGEVGALVAAKLAAP